MTGLKPVAVVVVLSAVCEGLPTVDVGRHGSWPTNCANTPVGQFCYAQVNLGLWHSHGLPTHVTHRSRRWEVLLGTAKLIIMYDHA